MWLNLSTFYFNGIVFCVRLWPSLPKDDSSIFFQYFSILLHLDIYTLWNLFLNMMSPLQSSLSLALRPRTAACHNSGGPQSLFSVCVEPTGPVQRGSSAGCWFCLRTSFWPCTAFSIASLSPDHTRTSGTEASYKVVFGICFPGCAWCHGCPE